MKDEPTIFNPLVRALEEEAIRLYRAAHPEGPLWQELQPRTQTMWVYHAEALRKKEPT